MADLLNSSDVPLAPNASTTQTVLPDWYTNYAMGILSQQQAQSATPYPTYTGPRVADFTPDQQAGFEATRAAAGSYAPALTAAGGALTTAAGITPSSGAQGYLSASGQTAPSVVGGYLNHYISNVTDEIARLGNQNLTRNILPGIGDQFVGAGGYGGSRQAEAIGNAIERTQQDITGAQGTALAQGYQGALGAAQTDLARQGALATTAGDLGGLDVNAKLASGAALQSLGTSTQGLGLQGAGALTAAGGAQQGLDQQNLDIAYQDFLRQQGYDQTQIDALTKTLQGVAPAVPKGVLEQGYGAAPSGTTNSPSTLQTIANVVGSLLAVK